MILSRYYQANLFSSTSFIDKIPLSQQHMSNISNFYDVRPRTSLQNLFLRRDTSLSKEDNQDSWWFALAPQQGTQSESNNALNFQASNATSGSACLRLLYYNQAYL